MAGPTKAELLEEAAALGVEASEDMTKAEIKAAMEAAEAPVEEAAEEAPAEEPVVEEEIVVEEVVEEVVVEEAEPVVDPRPVAPAISQEATTQGGLTFLTDRAQ